MNLMFQTPALITTTIAATRIYRSLQQRARKPVIGASYLSDFQFATNPEFTLDVRNRTTLNMRSGATTGTFSNLGLSSLDVQFPKSYGRYREEDLMEYPLTPISESATGLEDLVLEHGGQIAEPRSGRYGDLSEDLAMELGEPPRYSQYAHSLGSAGSGGRSGVDDSVVGGSSQARTVGYPPAILQGFR
ncbi:hypothetical protein HETIRDRAFT_435138 [Heterobasidion irregulare TC 32-1]|uniref:Uncharacterized protein n=1 Tax=Heterobasidion irregulare (strain TC 32-1) TaxID=747525 RepID=W4K473_HETIT|nr:uncharacterized protein HETIRDRAFT_435138 [Heterobasidion irregulare TC 32-1]ETW79836.1 hypothetical protein HETIRDRAFT_435138 [Heterobasidion irregulare TC 32-1]